MDARIKQLIKRYNENFYPRLKWEFVDNQIIRIEYNLDFHTPRKTIICIIINNTIYRTCVNYYFLNDLENILKEYKVVKGTDNMFDYLFDKVF